MSPRCGRTRLKGIAIGSVLPFSNSCSGALIVTAIGMIDLTKQFVNDFQKLENENKILRERLGQLPQQEHEPPSEAAQAEVTQLRQQVSQLIDEIQRLQEQNHSLKRDLSEKDAVIARLQQRVKESQENTQSGVLKNENDKLRERIRHLELRVRELVDQLYSDSHNSKSE